MDLNAEKKRLHQTVLANIGYVQCLQEIQDLLREHPKAGTKALFKYLRDLETKKEQERQQSIGALQLAQRLSESEQPRRRQQSELPDFEDQEEPEEEFEAEPYNDEPEEIVMRASKQRPQRPNSERRSGVVSFSRSETSQGKASKEAGPLTDQDREFFG